MAKEGAEETGGKGVSRRDVVKYVGVAAVALAAGVAGGYYYANKPSSPSTSTTSSSSTSEIIDILLPVEPDTDAIETVVPNWNSYSGVTADVTSNVPDCDWPAVVGTDLQAQMTNYDVVSVFSTCVASWNSQGFLTPLCSYLNSSTYPNPDLSDIIPGALSLYNLGGQQLAIPYTFTTELVYYRTDLFESAGIAVPSTMQEYLSAVQYFTDSSTGFYGTVLQGNQAQVSYEFEPFLYSFGGGVLDSNNNVIINSSEAVAALEFYASLLPYAPPDTLSYFPSDQRNWMLSQGKVAIMVSWNSSFPLTLDTSVTEASLIGKIGAAPIPSQVQSASIASGEGMFINPYSNNQTEAYKFINYITSENEESLDGGSGLGPCRLSTFSNAALVAKYPYFTQFAQAMKSNLVPWPKVQAGAQLRNIVGLAVSQALAGTTSAEDALNSAATSITQALASSGTSSSSS